MSKPNITKGYVYVLSNPSMPDLVKIGRSIHGGRGRADDLYRNDTGVPTPFELEFEILVSNAPLLEEMTHQALAEYRVNARREFFRIDWYEAMTTIAGLAASQMGVEYGKWPNVISIREEWKYQESEINEILASHGHEPIDQDCFAIEVMRVAYDEEIIAERIMRGREIDRPYIGRRKELEDQRHWELH